MHFLLGLALLACTNDPSDDSGQAAAAATSCASSAAELAGCVDGARYQADLEWVAEERAPGMDHWQEVQDLCASTMAELGMEVELHVYESGVNVIGRMTGTVAPEEQVLVSAHYDHIRGCQGADDNATGVAGLLESARVLAQGTTQRSLVFACWDEEERGLLGSEAWAVEAATRGDEIITVFNYEMIGYATDEPGSQELPVGLDLLFPDQTAEIVANEYRGDFIAVIADEGSASAVEAMSTQAEQVGIALAPLVVSNDLINNPALSDLQRSDHASFWAQGYPAMMITDTSEFRYDAYHCRDGDDVVDNLDQDFATGVVATSVGAIGEVAGWQAP